MQYYIKSVDGHAIRQPSTCTPNEQYVNDADSGRAASGLMYVGIIAEKMTLELGWNAIWPEVCHELLSIFKAKKYFDVEYYDMSTGDFATKTFYIGDRSTPIVQWFDGGEACNLSFTIIER